MSYFALHDALGEAVGQNVTIDSQDRFAAIEQNINNLPFYKACIIPQLANDESSRQLNPFSRGYTPVPACLYSTYSNPVGWSWYWKINKILLCKG